MFKSISIKAKLLTIVISSIVIVSVAMILESVISLQNTSETIIDRFKKDAYLKKELELRNYVSLAMKTVDSYYQRTSKDKIKTEVQKYLKEQTNFMLSIMEGEYEKYKGKMPENELKEIIRNAVKSSRYGQSGYFWINDTDAVIVMHPIKPHLDGKDLYNFKDKGGKQIFKEFAKVAKEHGDGFVDYVWPKPGFEAPQPKVSYVKLFKPYNWVIGTGEYVSDVTSRIQTEALKTISSMRFGKDGYFWINDSKPKMIMHPIKPQLDGKDLSSVKDPKGKYLFNEMAKVSNEHKEGGLVKYMWSKPGKSEPQPKFSYVQRFEAWDWIIGTGDYVDNIEEDILKMREQTNEEILNVIIKNIIIIFVIMIVLAFAMAILSNKAIFKPLHEFQEGLLNFFKYLNKESRDVVHLDDSADDEIGKMAKIINQNVVKTKSLIEQDQALINDVTRVVEKVKDGYLTSRVEARTENESLQRLQVIFNEMLVNLQSNVGRDTNEILKVLESFAKLDFTEKIQDPEGKISKALNELAEIINKMLYDNLRTGTVLKDNAKILTDNVDTLSRSSNEQAASLEQTAAALEEITSTIINNTENIVTMSKGSDELSESIHVGEELANSTVTAMDEINEQTQSIAESITVIDQIAFQTNILSLNAAVEAATAGEAGKGFAVVAQEVRNLASRSAEAAKEIKDLVESATSKTDAGKQIADDMITGYKELNEKIQNSTKLISNISTASQEQRTGIEQINDAVTELDRATQQNAAIASQTADIAMNTNDMAIVIVDEANKAHFHGKNDLKVRRDENPNYSGVERRKRQNNTYKVDTKRATSSTRKVEPVKPKVQPKPQTKTFTSNSNDDDEWESF